MHGSQIRAHRKYMEMKQLDNDIKSLNKGVIMRLWIDWKSDLRSGKGHGASEKAQASIYWGNASDSKLCAKLDVLWPKTGLKPYVSVTQGKDLEEFVVLEEK